MSPAKASRKKGGNPAKKSAGRGGRGRRRFPIPMLVLLLILALAGAGVTAVHQYLRGDATPTEAAAALQEALQRAGEVVPESLQPLPPPGEMIVAQVRRVVDGDTLLVSYGGREDRIRLLNVNTPESVHSNKKRNHPLGKEASEFTRSRLENSQIRLELPPGDSKDSFGRTLAYVFADGENFNVELVREGWSHYYTKYGRSARYDSEFSSAEREARNNRRGIWADEDYVATIEGERE